MKNVKLSSNVIYVLETLKSIGFEGYIVGGCVRDMLLGKTPNDWDVTTNATPPQIMEIFPRTVDIGANHGTVGIVITRPATHSTSISCPNGQPRNLAAAGSANPLDEGFNPQSAMLTAPLKKEPSNIIELTTYRIDGEYTDNRRPEAVTFTPNLAEDLARRDFTINALAWDGSGEVIDLHGGLTDIENEIIRCVGDANQRFQEDALRMLRAIRFAAQLGFAIEVETYNAICENAKLIQNISAERIRMELDKILLSDNTEHLKTIVDTGLGEFIFSEFVACFQTPQNTKYHLYNVGEHTLKAVASAPKNLNVRLAALLHDWGKTERRTTDDNGVDHFYGHAEVSVELARKFFNRLKYSNEIKDYVLPLVKEHDTQINPEKKAVKRAINRLLKAGVGDEVFLDLLDLKIADTLSQNPEYSTERRKLADELREIYFEIKRSGEAFTLADLAINGRDLMDIGIPEGKAIGEILKQLLDAVLETPHLNDRQTLIEMAGVMSELNSDS